MGCSVLSGASSEQRKRRQTGKTECEERYLALFSLLAYKWK